MWALTNSLAQTFYVTLVFMVLFLPITLQPVQESIFTLRHGGLIRNQHPKIHRSRSIVHPFHKNFLKFWASDLVGAQNMPSSQKFGTRRCSSKIVSEIVRMPPKCRPGLFLRIVMVSPKSDQKKLKSSVRA